MIIIHSTMTAKYERTTDRTLYGCRTFLTVRRTLSPTTGDRTGKEIVLCRFLIVRLTNVHRASRRTCAVFIVRALKSMRSRRTSGHRTSWPVKSARTVRRTSKKKKKKKCEYMVRKSVKSERSTTYAQHVRRTLCISHAFARTSYARFDLTNIAKSTRASTYVVRSLFLTWQIFSQNERASESLSVVPGLPWRTQFFFGEVACEAPNKLM